MTLEQLPHRILESTSEGVHCLDREGRIIFVNPAACQMLGWSRDELLGKVQHATIHHSHATGEALPPVECEIVAALRDGCIHHRDDEVFWRKDGTSFPVDYLASPILENEAVVGLVVAFRDLTERRNGEEHAARSLSLERTARIEAERLTDEVQRVLMQVPAAICITHGPDHVIRSANTLYRQLVGNRQLDSLRIRDAFPELEGQGMFELLDRVYATGDPHVGKEVRVVWGRDSEEPEEGFVDRVYQPLRDQENRIYGIMMHVSDVTEHVHASRSVEQRGEQVAQMASAVARINRELDQFAYVASHDLKAPLRGIASLAHWIEEDLGNKLGEEGRRYLHLLHTRVRRMEALIEGILEYSRAGRIQAKVEVVDVTVLVAECVELLNPPPTSSVTTEPAMPTFETERVPLQQVLLNLIGNALKHSRRPDTIVRIRVADDGDFYLFSVTDNGPGIPPEYHDKIWEIFQTLEPRDRVEGTGIGLALVKKTVENRRGRIWMETHEGIGTTFSFLWPKHPHTEEA